MPLPEHIEENIVVGMYDRGLLGFPDGGIALKSGRQSPYYYNMRGSLSFSRELDRSGQMTIVEQQYFRKALAVGYAAMFGEIEQPIDHVFGKAQAATAPAAVGAYEAVCLTFGNALTNLTRHTDTTKRLRETTKRAKLYY